MITTRQIPEGIRPVFEWADAILSSLPTGSDDSHDQTEVAFRPPKNLMNYSDGEGDSAKTPDEMDGDAAHIPDIFTPDVFDLMPGGVEQVAVNTLMRDMNADFQEAVHFSKTVAMVVEGIQSYENWVIMPLSNRELIGLHANFHEAMYWLAEQNDGRTMIDEWSEESRAWADRMLLAIAYILVWQSYGNCVQFIWTMASPWFLRLGEVAAASFDNSEAVILHPALRCLQQRVRHFDSLLYGFYEGAGDHSGDFDLDENFSHDEDFEEGAEDE